MKENHKPTRENYKDFQGFFGKESFFDNEFGVIKNKFDIEEGF